MRLNPYKPHLWHSGGCWWVSPAQSGTLSHILAYHVRERNIAAWKWIHGENSMLPREVLR